MRLNVEPFQRFALLHPRRGSHVVDREGSERLDHSLSLVRHEQTRGAAAASHGAGETRQHVHFECRVVHRAVSRALGSSAGTIRSSRDGASSGSDSSSLTPGQLRLITFCRAQIPVTSHALVYD